MFKLIIGAYQTCTTSSTSLSEANEMITTKMIICTHFATSLFNFSRFVSYYTLPTHNLTSPSNNVTYHHSRLMGVSDIENAVRKENDILN